MKACQKVTKPRKQFDATKARVKGTDLEKYVLPNGKPKKPVKQVSTKNVMALL